MGMGYYVVNPSIDGRNVLMYVHRIVADAFLGERPAGVEVNHIDGDKLNNAVSNLEYVTHERNMAHARGMGLIKDATKYPGHVIEAARARKLAGEKTSAISSDTGISARHLRDIFSNKMRSI